LTLSKRFSKLNLFNQNLIANSRSYVNTISVIIVGYMICSNKVPSVKYGVCGRKITEFG
jgi:hypothetical protein